MRLGVLTKTNLNGICNTMYNTMQNNIYCQHTIDDRRKSVLQFGFYFFMFYCLNAVQQHYIYVLYLFRNEYIKSIILYVYITNYLFGYVFHLNMQGVSVVADSGVVLGMLVFPPECRSDSYSVAVNGKRN